MQILLANPRGFCAGVERAIDIVQRTLELHGPPVYVRHEVVHNRFVTQNLQAKGARFVEELDEVPDGATVIFSAHGVSRQVQEEATRRGRRTSATPPRTVRTRCRRSRARFSSCWWSALPTAPTPTGCGNWRRLRAS